ncbi:MAG: TfoX/Sxy family protein [Parvularculaceae bacterium]|nr:TfoX/Sxy family protein [Parvularculaceae bacterium]
MTRIRDLLNLGPVMEERLAAVGVDTAEEMARIGAVECWRRLRFAHGKQVTLIALYAMDAAIDGVDWRSLGEDRKAALREEAGASEGATLGAEA